MTSAKLAFPNGTIITIDGTVEDIQKLVELYGNFSSPSGTSSKSHKSHNHPKPSQSLSQKDHITEIVNKIKDCEESDVIEKYIIDKTSEVNRVLLPLYIIHEYMENTIALQSGEISKITKELGIPISQPNVSRSLSGSASRFVMGDRTRKASHVVKYKLNRRGLKYMKEIIKGKQAAEQ
ncbi:MAG: hypothetical protein ABSH16_02630 [Sedimentisphaerales bacterium]